MTIMQLLTHIIGILLVIAVGLMLAPVDSSVQRWATIFVIAASVFVLLGMTDLWPW